MFWWQLPPFSGGHSQTQEFELAPTGFHTLFFIATYRKVLYNIVNLILEILTSLFIPIYSIVT